MRETGISAVQDLAADFESPAAASKPSTQAQWNTTAQLEAQVQAALQQSEDRFRLIADASPVFVWMTKADKSFCFFNRAWLAFRGKTIEQESAQGWMTGIHPEDRQKFHEGFEALFTARKPFAFHFRIQRRDGIYRWWGLSGVPYPDVHGQFAGYIGSCTDLTEQREVETAAHELSGRLIKAQDEQRARLARELHDDVTQRLARIANDVGHFTKHAALDEADRKTIGGIGESLVRLTQDVHALSYDLHPSVLIELGLEDALKGECDRIAKSKAIAVPLRMRDLPKAIARDNAFAIFRIAQEALNNAVRHGHASRIEVTLRGIDGGLQLVVRDNGVGFNPSKKRTTPSLGLASMQERTRLVRGELDIEGEPGHGTSVICWIPG